MLVIACNYRSQVQRSQVGKGIKLKFYLIFDPLVYSLSVPHRRATFLSKILKDFIMERNYCYKGASLKLRSDWHALGARVC